MVVLLVLAMFITLILFDVARIHLRSQATQRARRAMLIVESDGGPPSDLLLHPGHTWARVHDSTLVSVGVTDFAANFAGDIATIDVPDEGGHVRQADPACTVVAKDGRRLPLLMPVTGQVLAVNRALLRQPELAQRRPYDAGWLLRVRPRRLADSLRNLMPPAAARQWLDAIRGTVSSRIHPELGALAQDGGGYAPAFGDRLSDEQWDQLQRELFAGTAALTG